jgi:hypothetical protein
VFVAIEAPASITGSTRVTGAPVSSNAAFVKGPYTLVSVSNIAEHLTREWSKENFRSKISMFQLLRPDLKFSGPIQNFEKWSKTAFFQMNERWAEINLVQIINLIFGRELSINYESCLILTTCLPYGLSLKFFKALATGIDLKIRPILTSLHKLWTILWHIWDILFRPIFSVHLSFI